MKLRTCIFYTAFHFLMVDFIFLGKWRGAGMIGSIFDLWRPARLFSPKVASRCQACEVLSVEGSPLGWVLDYRCFEPHDVRCVQRLAGGGGGGGVQPGAVVVHPARLGSWRKKTLQLAQEGLIVGAFTEAGEARRWVQSKALTQRCQAIFEQIQ